MQPARREAKTSERRDTGVVDIDCRPVFEGDTVECLQWEPDAHAYDVFNGGVIALQGGEFRVGVTGVPLREYKAPKVGCEVRVVFGKEHQEEEQ